MFCPLIDNNGIKHCAAACDNHTCGIRALSLLGDVEKVCPGRSPGADILSLSTSEDHLGGKKMRYF